MNNDEMMSGINHWTTMFSVSSVGGHDRNRLFHVAYGNKGFSKQEQYHRRYDDAILNTYQKVKFRVLITCEIIEEDKKKRGSV